jgi:hypothetical protein
MNTRIHIPSVMNFNDLFQIYKISISQHDFVSRNNLYYLLSLTPIFVKTLIKESRFYAPIFSRYLIVLVVEKLERFGFWIITAFAGSHYALFT